MDEERVFSKSEDVLFENLITDFLNLRVGEEIPRLEIKNIKKITNKTKQGNLPGVDYKYIIETKDNKVLTVNSWILWKKIASALHNAGTTHATLELRHPQIEEYSVRVIR